MARSGKTTSRRSRGSSSSKLTDNAGVVVIVGILKPTDGQHESTTRDPVDSSLIASAFSKMIADRIGLTDSSSGYQLI
ncbi:hypothetical protein KQX54_020801 [Cotesia glomerata]|uniref:Uncharacterized protein n=1 Tax=Cotesia glomerata TaxID=32391 RepID=A0AAV7IHU4_COTGL|nr:hypothetical protein KQX54_020801 [Cotesia glomerata]